MKDKKKGLNRFALFGIVFLAGLCLIAIAVNVITNKTYLSQSTITDRLSEIDKARIAEVFHLRIVLGDQVLPGWAEAEIPVIAFNQNYIFLVGYQNPAAGWRKVHPNKFLGGPWEAVPEDEFFGETYYRQKLPSPGEHSENFTVQVGDRWVASLMSLDWMRSSLAHEIRSDLPDILKPLVPYGLVVNLLVPSSDRYITGVLHEAIHAYQGIRARPRLISAETASGKFSGQYPWITQSFQDDWQIELDILQDAMRASSQEETALLASAFLDQRMERRQKSALSADLIDYERQREWVEGIAMYGERMTPLIAAQSGTYQSLPEMQQDQEFRHYRDAQQKFDQEISQISRMAGDDGDGRFYYSGFAQAVILDRLAPGWKARLFEDHVWLEDLLAEALMEP